MTDFEKQINDVNQQITDAGAAKDRERLREIITLAEARLSALSLGTGIEPAHVCAERGLWRQAHTRAHRVLARTYAKEVRFK